MFRIDYWTALKNPAYSIAKILDTDGKRPRAFARVVESYGWRLIFFGFEETEDEHGGTRMC